MKAKKKVPPGTYKTTDGRVVVVTENGKTICGLARGLAGTARLVIIASCLGALVLGGCRSMSIFRGGTTKQNAVQAIVTVTRAADALMTAAGIAYNAGAFGAPGSQRAEETWGRISSESTRMHDALTAWDAAIRANKDATTYSFAVAQALAVIAALLPGGRAELTRADPPLALADFRRHRVRIARLASPDAFREGLAFGGAR